jgi:hypothetical protein
MSLSAARLLFLCLLLLGHISHAGMVAFLPSGIDVAISNRNQVEKYDDWNLNPNSLVGRTIVSTSLFIEDLLDWQIESDDLLYVRLLNDTKYTGINPYAEMEASGDYFVGRPSSISLVTYADLLTYATSFLSRQDFTTHSHNVYESQIATLMSYEGDGKFSMVLDPDCRFFWGEDMNLIVNVAPPTPPAEIRDWIEELHIEDEEEEEKPKEVHY